MSNDLNLKEFEIEFKKSKEIFKTISEFLIINDFKLLEINENIFFNKEKIKMSRFNVYYTNFNPSKDIQYLYGRKIFEDLKVNSDVIMKNLNKFVNDNSGKIQVVNFTNNHFIEERNLYLRISVFYKSVYKKIDPITENEKRK